MVSPRSFTPGLDPNSPRFTAANNACKHLLPGNGVPRENTISPADRADYLKAAACMRSHGVPNFPDPTFNNGSVTLTSPTPPINTSSAGPQLFRKASPRKAGPTS
jgi:hypothetical protein